MKKIIFVFLIAITLTTSASMLLTTSASREGSGAKPFSPARKGKPPAPAPPGRGVQAVAGQSAVLLPDGSLLITGGERQGVPTAEAQIIDPQTGGATSLSTGLRQSRAGHSSTVLPDGSVLIAGGIGAKGRVLNSAELYDPESRSFQPLGSRLREPRAYHTATLLTDGDVLLVGGASRTGHQHDRAELLDTRVKRFVPLRAQPGKARRKHTATLQSDGRALLWGGVDEHDVELIVDGERFDPSTHSWNWVGEPSAQEDTSPPWLAQSLPADGETDVPTDARIALRFSKPLRVGRVNAVTVSLSRQQENVPARVVAAEGGRLVFITPAAPLLPGSVYTINGSDLVDGANQPLPPLLITFTTKGDGQKESGTPKQSDRPAVSGGDGQWNPGAERGPGSWRSNRPASPLQSLPPFQAAPGVTALAGQVLSLDGEALRNVTLRMGDRETVTDSTGRFLLSGVQSGRGVLLIDGFTATSPRPVSTFDVLIDINAGRTNVLPFTVWLPYIDTQRATKLPVPTPRQMKAVTSLMPGLEVQIPADTVLRYPNRGHHHGMNSADNLLTSLSITPMPADRPPFPLPAGLEDGLLFTLQLHGASTQGLNGERRPGIRIVYPNYANLSPGSRYSLWNYDPTGKGWYVYGLGTVSADGQQVLPDPGAELQSMYCVVVINPLFGNGANAPGRRRPACGGCPVADPVDLYSGLFTYQKTDLTVLDDAALSLTRTYRQNDPYVRGFGIGTSFDFEMFVIGDNTTFQTAEVILPSGSRLKFKRVSFSASGGSAILEQTDVPGNFHKSTLRWNGARAPVGWDLITGDGMVYEFNNTNGKLRMVQDRNGNRLTISDSGLTTKITSSSGRWIELHRENFTNRIVEARDQLGRSVKYQYDADGRLWKVTNPDNKVTEYTYDSTHRMLTIKDARGIVFVTNEYDITTGRVRKQILSDETPANPADDPFYLFNYTLDANGNATAGEVTDPLGHVRRVTFNPAGYVLTSTEGFGTQDAQTMVFERQAGTNFLLSMTDALSRKTTYTYDAMGNVTEITRLAGTAQPVKTSYTYEPRFQYVATITDPLNHVVTITHDKQGNVTRVRDHLNHEGAFTYDQNGRMLTASDPLGNTREYTYDAGVLVKVRDPLRRTISRFVDRIGRTTHVTDQLGQTGRIEYDNLSRPVRIYNTKGEEIALSYDENGNVLSVTDPRLGVVRYTYDRQDRLVARKDGLLQDDSYEYDKNGNVTKATNRRGKVTRFKYDALDRLTFAGYGATGEEPNIAYESTVSYTYDAADRLMAVADSVSGNHTFGYDDLDRLTSATSPRGTVGYTYDAAGRRATMSVPGQPLITYGYDEADRLTSITQGTMSVSFAYDAADRRTELHLPFGVSVYAEFDEASQLSSLTYKRGQTVLGDLFYEYDNAGRRSSVSGSFARVLMPQPIAPASYDAANRLTQRGATAYTYDTNGNLLSDGANTYTWDARDQLASINGPGVSANFQYDAFGRRQSKTVNGQTTEFLYDGNNVVQEQTGGALANILTGSLDEVFLRVAATTSRTYLTDALGSTLALLDATGTVQTQYTYDPFGQTTVGGEASTSPTQFAGRENDGTGLYFNRARYYSPGLQRFISEDPAGFAGGMNPYAYADNNPVSFTDPHGTWPTIDTVADVTFIGYDIYRIARDGRKNLGTNLAALGLDVLCLAVPIATGGGAAYRGTGVVLMHAGSRRTSQAAMKTYQRPGGFRQGVRDEVWENAKGPDGNVHDPVTNQIMDKDQPWDMGHLPGFEFRKHQQSAAERGISRKQFLDECNRADHYRPELPGSNRSHRGEDHTDAYFGP
jgi:RHS repeat-associated protein